MGFKRKHFINYIKLTFITLATFLSSCAYVPKQAVELSATVGRDISEIRKSHIELADLYFKRLYDDINNFVDNVYLPFQIQRTLSDDFWREEMLQTVKDAAEHDPSGEKQKESYEKLKIFIQVIHDQVEDYRKELLNPVKEQHLQLITNLNDSYDSVHYANSIVTGHLASVVKVHESQNEILDKMDLKDLRLKISSEVSGLSDEVNSLVKKAEKGEEQYDKVIEKIEKLLKKKE